MIPVLRFPIPSKGGGVSTTGHLVRSRPDRVLGSCCVKSPAFSVLATVAPEHGLSRFSPCDESASGWASFFLSSFLSFQIFCLFGYISSCLPASVWILQAAYPTFCKSVTYMICSIQGDLPCRCTKIYGKGLVKRWCSHTVRFTIEFHLITTDSMLFDRQPVVLASGYLQIFGAISFRVSFSLRGVVSWVSSCEGAIALLTLTLLPTCIILAPFKLSDSYDNWITRSQVADLGVTLMQTRS